MGRHCTDMMWLHSLCLIRHVKNTKWRKQDCGGKGAAGGDIQKLRALVASPTICSSLSTFSLPPSHRFDGFESYDSRSSGLNSPRDLYRSGGSSYGCGDGRGDNVMFGQRGSSSFGGGMGLGGGSGGGGGGLGGGGGFDSPSSSYGVAKMRQNVRESFSSGQGGSPGAGGWLASGRRSPRRGGSATGRGGALGGGFASRRPEPTPLGGSGRGGGGGGVVGGQSHRGHSPGGGRGKLPSLLSSRMYPESGPFHQGSIQGPHDFPGRHFGGGPRAGRQRGRKRPLNKVSTSSLNSSPVLMASKWQSQP